MPGESIHDVDASQGDEAERSDEDGLAAVAEPTDRGVEVTFFPLEVDAADVPTTWLTADADSVVDLAAWR
ncbi:DUF7511 domain-containing protein [Haloarchaeobius sp. TZWSO28]|uniref:DUF7511 domain-containing protein n=1 Tax=Haloarchaeobius sp. TZWSO28 TaxID=3446119 RepID=UPI003EBE7A88